MATLDQVKKQYAKLTARERFALLVAAADRDDDPEITALLKSAPRKSWNFPDTAGLNEGFQFAGTWYMMNQLGYMASMYWLMDSSQGGTEALTFTYDGQKITKNLDDFLGKLFSRVLCNHVAWLRLCEEYKIDPEALIKNYPHYDMMQLLIAVIDGAAHMTGAEDLDEAEINKALAWMHETIDHYTKGWE